MEKFYTVAEVATILGVHPETISRMVRVGDITHARIGRRVVFSRADLDDFIAANTYRLSQDGVPRRLPRPAKPYEQLLAERLEIIRASTAKRIPMSERDFRRRR